MDIQCKCICRLCGKPLVKIGNARKNGANHIDWNSRKYHKKCTLEGKALDVKKNEKSMSRFLQDINFRTDKYFVNLFKDLILSKYNNIHICDQNMTNMRMTRSF